MELFELLTEIKNGVYSKIPLEEIDRYIKNEPNKKDFYAKFLEAVSHSTIEYVKKLSESEFNALKIYVIHTTYQNSKNVMLSTIYEDGFVAADALVEVEISRFITNFDYSMLNASKKGKKGYFESSENEMGN